jgi:plasmid stabilization system protein ParE
VIRLSAAARAQIASLTAHYEALDRADAARKDRAALARANDRIIAGRGLFYDAPRPYPELAHKGWQWTKEGPYWIAFAPDARGPVIRAVFHEAADIPRRI